MLLKHSIPILLYHKISRQPEAGSTHIDRFRKHLDFLKGHGWRSLRLAEMDQVISGTRSAPEKSFLLTFDDGHHNLPELEPDLAARGFTAVAFIITGWMQENRASHLSRHQAISLVRNGIIEIASHTHTHQPFYKYPGSLPDLQKDLIASKRVIEDLHEGIPQAPHHLAWPWGKTSIDMMRIARETGFVAQYTVANVPFVKCGKEPLMPRLCAEEFPPLRFQIMITTSRSACASRCLNFLHERFR